MESLFGSLPEMLDFQRVFLQTLEERIASSPDFSTLETPAQFKVRDFYSIEAVGLMNNEGDGGVLMQGGAIDGGGGSLPDPELLKSITHRTVG